MTADLAASFRAVAEALPAGTAVPVPRELLLELLAAPGGAVHTSTTPAADLTVHQVAARFGRHPSTVRLWLERGALPGAYRFQGREWRIPATSLAIFEARAREQGAQGKLESTAAAAGGPANLADWRKVPA